jgi:hypothetical protein
MDFLMSHRAPSLPPIALAEVFDRLIWCLADNGAALLQVRESWLRSEDRDRVEVALAMNETYPFTRFEDMRAALTRITSRWPDLEPRCAELLESRTRLASEGE